MIGRVIGSGSYVPEFKMDNNKIAELVDTNDEWIQNRTGIKSRHIAKDETVSYMAIQAAKEALEDSKCDALDIDLIIVSTISAEKVLPCVACEVQAAIGASKAACFDMNAACTGFLFAYQSALGYIHMGIAKKVLIIGAEKLSRLVDWTDRGSCILFGDGAGAVVVEAVAGDIHPCIMHSDGSRGDALRCSDSGKISMDGRAVFEFAVRNVPKAIGELLDQSQMSVDDVDYFILHQANKRIIEAIAKRIHTSIDKFPQNIETYGNTSSASIPILLDELRKNGKIQENSRVVIAGFGAGLSWGASYIDVRES